MTAGRARRIRRGDEPRFFAGLVTVLGVGRGVGGLAMRTCLGLAVVGVIWACLGAGPAALGQQGERVMVTSSVSPVGPGAGRALSREMVERMGKALAFDGLQLEVALELFQDVLDKRQALSDGLRRDIEAARELAEGGDPTRMFSRIKEVTGSYQVASDALEQTYLEDLRAMLSAEQEAAWPKAERLHRRGKHLGSLTRSQARVDLDDLVQAEFASAYTRTDVSEVLDRWAGQVDGLLVERARKAEDMGLGGLGGIAFLGNGDDPYEPLRAIDGRIVSVSEQAVRTLEGVLEDDAIGRVWIRRAFARVYRQTDGERRLEAALGLGDLTTDQKERLQATAEQHERGVSAARDRWVAAEKEREAQDTLPPGMVVMIEGQEPTPSDLARKSVDEFDRRVEEKLAAILSESQLALLPAKVVPAEEMMFAPAGGQGRSIRIGG